MKPKSWAKRSSQSNSLADPIAISIKWANSFLEHLPAPSAILIGIEEAALRICDANPYFSSEGKVEVSWYISVVKA